MASAALPLPDLHVRTVADVRVLFATLASGAVERCGFAYLDPDWRLLGMRETPPGAVDGADVPLRAVIADVLALDAGAVVMVHNHPSGDPTPSTADKAVTRRLSAALKAIDVWLVDHVVLARQRFASMRAMGLL